MFSGTFILQGWEGVTFHEVLQGDSESIKATHGQNNASNQSINMSHSPERMSSYRRHFVGTFATPSTHRPRTLSPSPTRMETHQRSASLTQGGGRAATSRAGMSRYVTKSLNIKQFS